MKSLYLLSFLASLVASTDLILPLYIYPLSGLWHPVYSAIEANPDLEFQVVVNPDSGPGDSTLPSSDYITAVAKLNSYSNVNLVGYVHTSYASASISSLETQISAYANWATYEDANIAVAGIFFDETSNAGTQDVYDYMSTLVDYTYDEMGDDISIVFNPGTTPSDTSLYDLATTIITAELPYDEYNDQSTIDLIPDGYVNQSAIIVHDYTGDETTLAELLQNLVDNGVQEAYFTSSSSYTNVTQEVATIGVVAADLATANAE